MNIADKKKFIIEEVLHTNDEALLHAIEKLLQIENDSTVPQWHKEIIRARIQEYKEHEEILLNWNDVVKDL